MPKKTPDFLSREQVLKQNVDFMFLAFDPNQCVTPPKTEGVNDEWLCRFASLGFRPERSPKSTTTSDPQMSKVKIFQD